MTSPDQPQSTPQPRPGRRLRPIAERVMGAGHRPGNVEEAIARGDGQAAERLARPTSGPADAVDPGTVGDGGPAAPATGGRRTSQVDEVRDGGYSVGSAAPLPDGAMPVGHPVKAWQDTMTYATPDHPVYEQADPHVWFMDAETAERCGFARVR